MKYYLPFNKIQIILSLMLILSILSLSSIAWSINSRLPIVDKRNVYLSSIVGIEREISKIKDATVDSIVLNNNGFFTSYQQVAKWLQQQKTTASQRGIEFTYFINTDETIKSEITPLTIQYQLVVDKNNQQDGYFRLIETLESLSDKQWKNNLTMIDIQSENNDAQTLHAQIDYILLKPQQLGQKSINDGELL